MLLKKEIDSRGLPCPQPVLNTKKALEELTGKGDSGFVLTVLVDNEVARENVTRFAKANGYRVTAEKKDDLFQIIIEPSQGQQIDSLATAEVAAAFYCSGGTAIGKTVYLFKSKTLGAGSEELGAILMRSFIFTLKETSPLPEKLLFINSAVYLTTEGSPVLEELQELEKLGIEIYSCGTCLDYFKLKDKLQVGHITNMYDTVENLTRAAKCITI
ncbi:MAG: sulfurtransferase-like selenium metabolism protein YedF [Firmicutes bacterium]|nr:sulfurtransferase-like selenium metabolism protein YedF [Bacillota bacterium]